MNHSPTLIEPGVSYFIKQSLYRCHLKRSLYETHIFNGVLLVVFILISVSIIYYKTVTKLPATHQREQQTRGTQYILRTIRSLGNKNNTLNDQLITQLPKFERSSHDKMREKYYTI
jgi:hypothetical protein